MFSGIAALSVALLVVSGDPPDQDRAAPRTAPIAFPGTVFARRSDQALEQAFGSTDFWWKRTRKVQAAEPSWLQWATQQVRRFVAYLWEQVIGFLEWLFGSLGITKSFAGVLSGLAWILIPIVSLFIAWMSWRILSVWLKADTAPIALRKEADFETLPEAAALFEMSAAAIRNGHYTDAVRFAFLALLAGLQSQGLLRYDRSRTNREYHHDLQRSADLARGFWNASKPFERVWYGRKAVDFDEATAVLAQCQNLVRQPEGRA